MIKLGTRDIGKTYYGSIPAEKIYAGSELVWPAEPPLPYDAEIEYVQIQFSSRIVEIPYPAYIMDLFTGKKQNEVTFAASASCSTMGTGGNAFFCGYGRLLYQICPYGPGGSTNMLTPGGSSATYGSIICSSPNDYHLLRVENVLGIASGFIDGLRTGGRTTPFSVQLVPQNFYLIKAAAQSSSAVHIIRQRECKFDVDGQTLIDAYPVRAGDSVGFYNKIDGIFYGLSTLDYPEITAGPDKN